MMEDRAQNNWFLKDKHNILLKKKKEEYEKKELCEKWVLEEKNKNEGKIEDQPKSKSRSTFCP